MVVSLPPPPTKPLSLICSKLRHILNEYIFHNMFFVNLKGQCH